MTVTYPSASTVVGDAAMFAADRPVFFDGFLTHPVPAARAMASVAQIAMSRFYMPAAMLAAQMDPVVTAEPDRLRFESFSQCAGVHARLDLLDDGLDVRACTPGTTNVDFNAPTRAALAKITRVDPLQVIVGADAVTLRTFDAEVVEHKVPLPARWVKGFGEVQVALRATAPVLELDQVQARRFLSALPGGELGKVNLWAIPSGAAVRIGRAWQPGAVCLAGTTRLRVLLPLARFATGLRAYADPDAKAPTAVAWVLTMPGGRLTFTLSPEPNRGFSGEGGLLEDLATGRGAEIAARLRSELAHATRFTLDDRGAATWLGAHGHVGYDVTERTYFWRHLPYPDEALVADPPRLRDARKLVGAVQRRPDGAWSVTSGPSEYRVQDGRCTCPWVARHGTSRGPCKHVLAVALTVDSDH
jgi:SWIM zinc finger